MTNQRIRADGGMEASYGFRSVDPQEKQPMVDEVFHKVARRYDIMNDVMSMGAHRIWKDALVTALNPPRNRPFRFVDVAGGTADIAARIVRASDHGAHGVVVDINGSMLAVGRERAQRQGFADAVEFVEANAEELPFGKNEFDAYTIAFGIRNVPHIDYALKEAWRVLKPGGRFLCLEFSAVDTPFLDRLYDLWSMRAIPPIGRLVVGDDEPYRYLVESIRRFPTQRDFASMIEMAGFERVGWTNYTGGIVALHSGWKL